MRKIFTKGCWLLDVGFFDRDSFSLHLFFLSLVHAGDYSKIPADNGWQIKTPDIRIPMWTKPVRVHEPKIIRQIQEILNAKKISPGK